MANFSVIGHRDAADAAPDADLLAAETAAVGAPAAREGVPREPWREDGDDHEVSLPPVLLELPDLVAVSQWTDRRWSKLGDRIFWIGIIFGSVLALYLMWQPRRPAAGVREVAPTWDGQGTTAPAAMPTATTQPTKTPAAAEPQNPSQLGAPATTPGGTWQEEATGPVFDKAAPPPPVTEQDAPPPGHESAPSFDEWSRQQPASTSLYTARGGETRMDGGGEHVAPGEAMPTGKIKNVVTP